MKRSLDTMRSTVVCLLLLFVLIAIGVDGGKTSSASNTVPPKWKDRPVVICNAVQDSHCNEAIKSLEANLVATMEK